MGLKKLQWMKSNGDKAWHCLMSLHGILSSLGLWKSFFFISGENRHTKHQIYALNPSKEETRKWTRVINPPDLTKFHLGHDDVLYQFAEAAQTKCHRMGSLNNRNQPLTVSEARDTTMVRFCWEPSFWLTEGCLLAESLYGRERELYGLFPEGH